MTERTNITLPVGRFISGSLTDKRTKDMSNRPIDPEKQRYEFGVAVKKDDPDLTALFQAIAGAAKAGYAAHPHIVARIDNWFNTMDGFSMKISDGDKPNQRGQVNENSVGCFVFWFSTSIEIKCCMPDNTQIDSSAIKRGWHVDVAGSVAVNGLLDHNAGIYLNPEWVRLRAYGDEIQGGIDADQAFGSAAPDIGPPPAGSASGAPGGGMPGGAPGGGMPGNAPSNPATPAPASGVPGAPVGGGMPGSAGAPGSETASPGNNMPNTGHPPHPGVLGGGLPGQN